MQKLLAKNALKTNKKKKKKPTEKGQGEEPAAPGAAEDVAEEKMEA